MAKRSMKRTLTAIVVFMIIASLLSGCAMIGDMLNPFDPVAYVQGNLDTNYLGLVTDEYLETVVDTEEECLQAYEDGLAVEAEYFIEYFNIEADLLPPEYKDIIIEMYRQIYAYSRYEVGESTETDSGYVVSVTVYPIDIMQKVLEEDSEAFMTDWNNRLAAGEFNDMSNEEFEQAWADSIIAMVTDRINTIGYLEPQTISVQINREGTEGNSYYIMNSEDFQKIDEVMIQY